jgi:hypothetical protein
MRSNGSRAHSGRPPGPSIITHFRSALFSVLSDVGTPSSLDIQKIANQRRAISAFGVGLSRQAQTESAPRSRPARSKCLARHRGARWMRVRMT